MKISTKRLGMGEYKNFSKKQLGELVQKLQVNTIHETYTLL